MRVSERAAHLITEKDFKTNPKLLTHGDSSLTTYMYFFSRLTDIHIALGSEIYLVVGKQSDCHPMT